MEEKGEKKRRSKLEKKTQKQKRGKTVIFVSNSWTTVHVHVELSLTAATRGGVGVRHTHSRLNALAAN